MNDETRNTRRLIAVAVAALVAAATFWAGNAAAQQSEPETDAATALPHGYRWQADRYDGNTDDAAVKSYARLIAAEGETKKVEIVCRAYGTNEYMSSPTATLDYDAATDWVGVIRRLCPPAHNLRLASSAQGGITARMYAEVRCDGDAEPKTAQAWVGQSPADLDALLARLCPPPPPLPPSTTTTSPPADTPLRAMPHSAGFNLVVVDAAKTARVTVQYSSYVAGVDMQIRYECRSHRGNGSGVSLVMHSALGSPSTEEGLATALGALCDADPLLT